MVSYTNYFTLSHELQEVGFSAPTPALTEGMNYSEEDLRSALEEILGCINTLDDYSTLVDILNGMKDRITLRFLYIFYQALASVEERVWASAGMHPPIRELVDDHIDLLLDQYTDYILVLEQGLVDWTKENGFFDDPVAYEFILKRNQIFAKYSVLAGEIINGHC